METIAVPEEGVHVKTVRCEFCGAFLMVPVCPEDLEERGNLLGFTCPMCREWNPLLVVPE